MVVAVLMIGPTNTSNRGTAFSLVFSLFNDTATTEIYTLSLHDALPILAVDVAAMRSMSTWLRTNYYTYHQGPRPRIGEVIEIGRAHV